MTTAQIIGYLFNDLKNHLREQKIYFKTDKTGKIIQIIIPQTKRGIFKKQRTGLAYSVVPKAVDGRIVFKNLLTGETYDSNQLLNKEFTTEKYGELGKELLQ